MDITEDDVDEIYSVLQTVEGLADEAEAVEALDEDNLGLLAVQLDALHQSLALAVVDQDE